LEYLVAALQVTGTAEETCQRCGNSSPYGLPVVVCEEAGCDLVLCGPCGKEPEGGAASHQHAATASKRIGLKASGIASHSCDVCSQAAQLTVYRCKDCDYDLCPFCFVQPSRAEQ